MNTKATYGRLPNKIIDAHEAAGIRLSPICCNVIDEYKQQLDGALKQRSSTTLKNMSEIRGEPKKDFSISSGKMTLMNSQLKRTGLKQYGLGNDRKYEIDPNNDIKFLGNNTYEIKIHGNTYGLGTHVTNNSDINITLKYEPEEGKIKYTTIGERGGIVVLNRANVLNPHTFNRDKVVQTKINFRAQNKDFELVVDIPFTKAEVNDKNYGNTKIAA